MNSTTSRSPGTGTPARASAAPDALTIGRRVRHFRKRAGLTLEQLGTAVDRAASQISAIESGHREPSLTMLGALARALSVSTDDLLDPTPVDRRQALEIEAERHQASALYASLRLPRVRVKALPNEALEAMVGLQRELATMAETRAATPEEARRANRELRDRMRRQHNYFGDVEEQAARLLDIAEYRDGPLSQRQAARIADHLGFSLHYVPDLPRSTRSVIDVPDRRLYLSNVNAPGHDPRSTMLTALASHVLGHTQPGDYSEFLAQRVQANYLTAALLMPESAAVPLLQDAKKNRKISIEELRDHFGATYEAAAHRFTNLATEHLDLKVHFMKVHVSGTIHKVYSNDGLPFPTDPTGAVEGQYACKNFTSRQVFRAADQFSPFYHYTDTPAGTYWCTARVLPDQNEFAVSVGVPFAEVRWFEGRETANRDTSTCPDPGCCRQPPPALEEKWGGDQSWPSARTHASLLAAVPPGPFPGVDQTEVYEFLERHQNA